MPRCCSTLVAMIAVLAARGALAQSAEDPNLVRLPPVDQPAETQLSPVAEPALGESAVQGPAKILEDREGVLSLPSLQDFVGYRYSTNSMSWIPGRDLGMFSLDSDHYCKSGIEHGLGFGMGFHFLDGPVETDMPPRLFDFSVGYQWRHHVGPLAFDLAAAVKASADFEGSAREGIRFPAHAVGFLDVGPELGAVFGVDFLDRNDVRILPVGGLIWIPSPDVRFEIVFPRPRAVVRVSNNYRLYVSGELGGGSWAVWRAPVGNDVATYRDLGAYLGIEHVGQDGGRSALEVGGLFGRRLEFSSNIGDMHLDDAFVLRMVTAF